MFRVARLLSAPATASGRARGKAGLVAVATHTRAVLALTWLSPSLLAYAECKARLALMDLRCLGLLARTHEGCVTHGCVTGHERVV